MAQHVKVNTKLNNWQRWGRAWIKAFRYCNWNPLEAPVGTQIHKLRYADRVEPVMSKNKFKDWPYSDRECERRKRQMARDANTNKVAAGPFVNGVLGGKSFSQFGLRHSPGFRVW